jgi:hypothetical protein
MLLYKGSKPNLRMLSGFQFFCRLMCCFDGIFTDRNKKCFMMVDLYNDDCMWQWLNFRPNTGNFHVDVVSIWKFVNRQENFLFMKMKILSINAFLSENQQENCFWHFPISILYFLVSFTPKLISHNFSDVTTKMNPWRRLKALLSFLC